MGQPVEKIKTQLKIDCLGFGNGYLLNFCGIHGLSVIS